MVNCRAKGYLDASPTTGGTYIVRPPAEYAEAFRSLQETISRSGLPIAHVRIPHATIIAGKIVDCPPEAKWSEREKVQKIYKTYILYQTVKRMEGGLDYRTGIRQTFTEDKSQIEAISKASSLMEAKEIAKSSDEELIRILDGDLDLDSSFCEIKQRAFEEIERTSFSSSLEKVKLTSNGSIIFEMASDERMLRLREDLIVAGQGISKWPNLTVMQNSWSTVGYLTRSLSEEEKKQADELIYNWVRDNQELLSSLKVDFTKEKISSLVFRSNDFHGVKSIKAPLVEDSESSITEEDLRLSPRAGEDVTPVPGRREKPEFVKESFEGVLDTEVKMGEPFALGKEK